MLTVEYLENERRIFVKRKSIFHNQVSSFDEIRKNSLMRNTKKANVSFSSDKLNIFKIILMFALLLTLFFRNCTAAIKKCKKIGILTNQIPDVLRVIG